MPTTEEGTQSALHASQVSSAADVLRATGSARRLNTPPQPAAGMLGAGEGVTTPGPPTALSVLSAVSSNAPTEGSPEAGSQQYTPQRQMNSKSNPARLQLLRRASHRIRTEISGASPSLSELAVSAVVDGQRELYLQACAEAGAKPISRILNHLGAPRLALRHYGIGPLGAGPLAAVLPSNTTWRVLSLADNRLEQVGAIALAGALARHSKLTDIDLHGNNMGPRGTCAILRALSHVEGGTATHLKRLRIGRNRVGDAIVEDL